MKTLKGKTALITGAAQGNGFGIAKVMAEKGANVIMTDKSGKVKRSEKTIRDMGTDGIVVSYVMDITREHDIESVVDEASSAIAPIDILVNNAGISLLTDIEDMDDRLWQLHFDINVNGARNCVKHILPGMMERRYGRIINISSVTGPRVCDPANIAYASTKAALIGFTKAIAIDTADKNITVNAILPGYFLTPMVELTAVETNEDDPQEVLDQIVEPIPMGRFGKPEEIGYLAAFLASDEAAYITGGEFVIDGGSTLPETVSVGR